MPLPAEKSMVERGRENAGRTKSSVNDKETDPARMWAGLLSAYKGAWAKILCKTHQTRSSYGGRNPKERCLRTEAMQMRAGTIFALHSDRRTNSRHLDLLLRKGAGHQVRRLMNKRPGTGVPKLHCAHRLCHAVF